MSRLNKILEDSVTDGRPVSEDLLPLIYDELRSLAANKLLSARPDQTIQATALVHEAWLKLGGDESRNWNDRAHFFRTAALAMRNILVDRARMKTAQKRGGGLDHVQIDGLPIPATTQEERVLLVNAALEELEAEHPDRAQIVSLKFFGGLTNKEIASMQGVTERTVERHWAYAKARLYELICDERGD